MPQHRKEDNKKVFEIVSKYLREGRMFGELGGGKNKTEKLYSCEALAKKYNVSTSSVYAALRILRSGREDIARMISDGTIALSAGYKKMKQEKSKPPIHTMNTKPKAMDTSDSTDLTIQKARLMLDIELLQRQKRELESQIAVHVVSQTQPHQIQQPRPFWQRLFGR